MALGNYWECVLHDDMGQHLQSLIDGTTILFSHTFPAWHLRPGGPNLGPADFRCLASPSGDIRTIAHLVKTSDRSGFYLHSAFPGLARGAISRLTVYSVRSDSFGLEGFVEAGTDGRSITFFAPLFARDKATYRVGGEYDFHLAAVSLNTRRAAPDDLDLQFESDPEAPDHYLFRGYLHTVRTTTYQNQSFRVFRTAVRHQKVGTETLLWVDIYVNTLNLDPAAPLSSGATITGSLWLQGGIAPARVMTSQ